MHSVIDYLLNTAQALPSKKAVAAGDISLTFAELLGAAQQLAVQVGSQGKPVAVFANRGVECIIGFMAAAYNSDVYVALDPALPAHKLQLILEDSGAEVVLGMEENRALLQETGFAGAFAVIDPANNEQLGTEPAQITADTPLCLIYTSGSTGKPKGVLKSHGAMTSFIEAFVDEFNLGSDEVIGNQTPFFFDASAKDLYLMLYKGCTMEIIPPEKFIFPVTLMEYLNERQITYACWVPTAFASVTQLKTFTVIKPQTLKHVFFVGEVFPRKQLQAWIDELPQLEYVNLYGSTETAGICCFHRIDTAAALPDPIPMGKPLGSNQVTLRAEDGSVITEPGTIGEVCINSPQLAICYLNDPEKTAKCFIGEGAERYLKTGDLARYDERGNLVFASRSDFQIKIQGRRIELGEIESVADGLDCIQRCACVFQEEKKKIVLFAELVPGSDANQKSIRAALRQRVSDYMVPGKVVILDALPYNANGKISRPALQALL